MREFLLLIDIIARAEEQSTYQDLFIKLEKAKHLYQPELTLNLILDITEIYKFPMNISYFDKQNKLREQEFRDYVKDNDFELNTPFVEILSSMCNNGISLTLKQNPDVPEQLGIVHTIVYQGRS